MRKRYRFLSKKGEGTFSEVLKAKCIATNALVATKCMKEHFSSIEEVNNLREIQALKRLSPHENIINLYEVVFEKKSGRLTLVFELMDMNLYMLIRKTNGYISDKRIMGYMHQLLKAIDHIHKRGIFHRDIKPENLLISGSKLKLADFGSCRGKYSKQPFTEYISTRWYRAPECLLTDGWYDSKMDIWGVGCVFFEVLALFPLFPGTNEVDQIERIHHVLGSPTKKQLATLKRRSSHIRFDFKNKKGTGIHKLIPHANHHTISLITQLLYYAPKRRITAYQSLKHRYFDEFYEIDKKKTSQKISNSIKGKTIGSLAPKPIKKTLSPNVLKLIDKNVKKPQKTHNNNNTSEKNVFQIEGNKYNKSVHRKRNKKKLHCKYQQLSNIYESNNRHHHSHNQHHRRHQKKMKKKDRHARSQIKLPKVKKLKKIHASKDKKSMIAMSKLQHSHSTATIPTYKSRNSNDFFPSIQSMKYRNVSNRNKFVSKYLTKKLPPVIS